MSGQIIFVAFESINYINETVFSLCVTTNGICFISHKLLAFNHKLNGNLFWLKAVNIWFY